MKFYEVQVSRVITHEHTAIRSTITAPIIAENKRMAWRLFCKQRKWSLFYSPSLQEWERTITEVDNARWEYLCVHFDDKGKVND